MSCVVGGNTVEYTEPPRLITIVAPAMRNWQHVSSLLYTTTVSNGWKLASIVNVGFASPAPELELQKVVSEPSLQYATP
jgi:hypothetical protein